MKRSTLLQHLRRHGCVLKREGSSHSLWTNVIHAFEKRTSQTREADIALARKRLADFLGQRARKKEAR